MTIQREYNLPNCKLVLEGFAPDGSDPSPRPLLSVVTHVECHLLGHEQPITGGRSLLQSLVPVVSHYAQEFLSGVPHPHHLQPPPETGQERVSLERIDADLHRLTIGSAIADTNGQGAGSLQLDLKTVQLFDLVEALDQMLADQQTVPDLSVVLAPVSRQYAVTHEPLSKRAIPLAIGLSSLAAAAIALFFLPIPERRVEPEPAAQEAPATGPEAAIAPRAAPDPLLSPSPEASPEAEASAEVIPEAAPVAEAVEADAEPDAPAPETAAAEAETDALDQVLDADEEITDPDAIGQLQGQLRDRLDEAWTQEADFPEELIYRVRVAANGDILGFRYMNDAAVENADKTPLLDLQYNPTDNTTPEASTEFRVVFTPGGVIEVSPWYGRPAP